MSTRGKSIAYRTLILTLSLVCSAVLCAGDLLALRPRSAANTQLEIFNINPITTNPIQPLLLNPDLADFIEQVLFKRYDSWGLPKDLAHRITNTLKSNWQDPKAAVKAVYESVIDFEADAQWNSAYSEYRESTKYTTTYSLIAPHVSTMHKGGVVVDVGCGNNALGKEIAANNMDLQVIGSDPYDYHEEYPLKNLQFRLQKDPYTLPFEDHSVDLIILNAALHHVADPDILLSEIYRVLKPGGRLILVEDTYSATLPPQGADVDTELTGKFLALVRKYGEAFARDYFAFNDWYANILVHKWTGMSLPYNFNSIESWIATFAKSGFKTVSAEHKGFAQRGFHKPCVGILIFESDPKVTKKKTTLLKSSSGGRAAVRVIKAEESALLRPGERCYVFYKTTGSINVILAKGTEDEARLSIYRYEDLPTGALPAGLNINLGYFIIDESEDLFESPFGFQGIHNNRPLIIGADMPGRFKLGGKVPNKNIRIVRKNDVFHISAIDGPVTIEPARTQSAYTLSRADEDRIVEEVNARIERLGGIKLFGQPFAEVAQAIGARELGLSQDPRIQPVFYVTGPGLISAKQELKILRQRYRYLPPDEINIPWLLSEAVDGPGIYYCQPVIDAWQTQGREIDTVALYHELLEEAFITARAYDRFCGLPGGHANLRIVEETLRFALRLGDEYYRRNYDNMYRDMQIKAEMIAQSRLSEGFLTTFLQRYRQALATAGTSASPGNDNASGSSQSDSLFKPSSAGQRWRPSAKPAAGRILKTEPISLEDAYGLLNGLEMKDSFRDFLALDDAYILARDILKTRIKRAVVVGTGLPGLPLLLSLMGKDVVFIDRSAEQCNVIDVYIDMINERLRADGYSDGISIRLITAELGSMDLAEHGLDEHSYDLVTMVDLIGPEPAGSPRQWLTRCKSLLKPERGLLIIDERRNRTPGSESLVIHFSDIFPFHRSLSDGRYYRGWWDRDHPNNRLYEVNSNAHDHAQEQKRQRLIDSSA